MSGMEAGREEVEGIGLHSVRGRGHFVLGRGEEMGFLIFDGGGEG